MIALETKEFVSSIEMKNRLYNFDTVNFSTHLYQDVFSYFDEYYLP